MASTRWPNGSTRAWRKQRERVLERDGFRCTHKDGRGRCSATVETARIEVHHKTGVKLNVPDRELAAICRSHHVLTFGS